MRELTAFDFIAVVEELKSLKGKYFQKFTTIPNGYKLKLRGADLLIKPPNLFFRTTHSIPSLKPDNFSLFLRKRLEGKKLDNIEVLNLDRVVSLSFGEYTLVLELFREGNIILLEEGKVITALRYGKWRHREIERGVMYKTPPPPPIASFTLLDDSTVERDMVRSGIPKEYTKEILYRLSLDPKAPTKDHKNQILDELNNILEELRHPSGFLCRDEPFPINLSHLPCNKVSNSFNELLDTFTPTLFQREKEEDKTLLYMKASLRNIEEEIEALEGILSKIYEHWNEFERLLKGENVSIEGVSVEFTNNSVVVKFTPSQHPHQ